MSQLIFIVLLGLLAAAGCSTPGPGSSAAPLASPGSSPATSAAVVPPTSSAQPLAAEPVVDATPAELAAFVQAVERQPTDASGCLTSCGVYPVLPRCAAELELKPLADVLASPARDALQGRAIAVRGEVRLERGFCTEAYCPGQCCNSCGGSLVLGGLMSGPDTQLLLKNAAAPNSVACSGDDRRICCAVPAEGEIVVVQGTLRRGALPGTSLELHDATLCVP
jgi:hypothetical protein